LEATLAVQNVSLEPVSARISLELLDTQDAVLAREEKSVSLLPGVQRIGFTLLHGAVTDGTDSSRSIYWHRLRYRLIPQDVSGDEISAEQGVLSSAALVKDLFELSLYEPEIARGGAPFRARVRATHPVTHRPVSGVRLKAELDVEDAAPKKLVVSGVTDSRGIASLVFPLPAGLETGDYDLEVTGTLGTRKESLDAEIRVGSPAMLLINTDKPLYQPGQILHIRLLAVEQGQRTLPDLPISLRIEDPEHTTVFRAKLTSSKFGVASVDWPIPENLRLGDYSIHAEIEEGPHDDTEGYASVKISRYELPQFTVIAKPDRAYYLPGQNAEIEIRADYLFGEPVRRGKVRVVRESSREWNFRAQKWDIEEEATQEGMTGATGNFIAKFDLSENHKDFTDNYDRFKDIPFVAYFTDLSTGRTEQRRFDLRITRFPIHVYVIELNSGFAEDSPGDLYLTASYADGSPAECEISVTATFGDRYNRYRVITPGPREEKFLRVVRTNSLGAAKIANFKTPLDSNGNSFDLLLLNARDSKGNRGEATESLWNRDAAIIRVQPDKAIYRSGDPIEVRVATNRPYPEVAVDVFADDRAVASRIVKLRRGSGFFVLSPNDKFEGVVTIRVHAFFNETKEHWYSSVAQGLRNVIFPNRREMKLDVRLDRATYRPGEQVSARFSTLAGSGRGVESALGLVVFDRAVEERARTESQFGNRRSRRGFHYSRSDYEGTIAGYDLAAIGKLDMAVPIPDGLDLVAEILLLHAESGYTAAKSFESGDAGPDYRKLFASLIDPQANSISKALVARYGLDLSFPHSEESLRSILKDVGISLDSFLDPWGRPYKAHFGVEDQFSFTELWSDGPDKLRDTPDDFRVMKFRARYFANTSAAIERALRVYHERTAGYIRDLATFESELAEQGVAFSTLRDPWNMPYRAKFSVWESKFIVQVFSAGPDMRFTEASHESYDDVAVFRHSADYFETAREQMGTALAEFVRTGRPFPENEAAFSSAMLAAGVDFPTLRDPWGHPYYLRFEKHLSYSDRVTIARYTSGPESVEKAQITPVTQENLEIQIRSAGEDGNAGSQDDFTLATYYSAITVQSAGDPAPRVLSDRQVLTGARGAITGTVTDQTGAVIANAKVTATLLNAQHVIETSTNSDGRFTIRDLPAGFYAVRVDSPGFKSYEFRDIPVRASSVTEIKVTLEVGAVMQCVEVSEGFVQFSTTTTAVLGRNVQGLAALNPGLTAGRALSTPRLREYFPETLYWAPEIITDARGRALVKFPLADNITTWKLSAIASTLDGNITTAEVEIRAFQPFFVENDLPKVLTEGDEIALPVVVRNYLPRAQKVELAVARADWFTALGPEKRNAEVAPQGDVRTVFPFRAVKSAGLGKHRVTALASDANDAIERGVAVHPNGEERVESSSAIFGGSAVLEAEIPVEAITGSLRAELKLYPSLMAQVVESIEGILQRPYGCGEQTISSTYPSMLFLKHAPSIGQENSALARRARLYLRRGYERLLGYRAAGGGISYWGKGEADVALTAYALRFLHDASAYVEVDDSVSAEAKSWLLKQQKSDGQWAARSWGPSEDVLHSAALTAYVARSLAHARREGPEVGIVDRAISKALDWLAPHAARYDEPYLLASFALAAQATKEKSVEARTVERLRRLAQSEAGMRYWMLETNTPFYGWGTAGRIETTALALQAIALAGNAADEPLLSAGQLFLLKNRDRYGVWHSTQATVNVLDALAALLARGARKSDASTVEVVVNGKPARSISLPPPGQDFNPIFEDLSAFLTPGKNRIELRRASALSPSSAQLLTIYYVPWKPASDDLPARLQGISRSLELRVRYTRLESQEGEDIECAVEVRRIGHRGYGMLLAEVGLPPGAEVQRESLEKVLAAGRDVWQYDILPDRVVFYVWPRAEGTIFSFTFRPRMGLNALTAPSLLYDYYNPEARAVVVPARFIVH
jgi:hypothetical protein